MSLLSLMLCSKLAAEAVAQAYTMPTAPPEPQLDLSKLNQQLANKRPVATGRKPVTQRLPLKKTGTVVPGVRFGNVLDAIRYVESTDGKYLYGDKDPVTGAPRAFGAYQIRRPYAIDADLNPKTWQKDVMDEKVSRAAVTRYMKRYARKYLPKNLDTDYMSPEAIQTVIRLHNGGPNALNAVGEKRKKLDNYYRKVMNRLIQMQQPR